jgi:fructose-specific phosphotransferase system IIB component
MESGTRIVVVTACPTGVALTYMAANRLLATAQRLGYLIKVETQGALGSEDILTRKDIGRAHAAIIAADVDIDGMDRFQNVPVLTVGTARAISDPEAVLAEALALPRA